MKRVARAFLVLFSVCGTAQAADPSAADRAAAEALFRKAKDLQGNGQIEEACAKYLESFTLDPKPGALLNVAACHEEEGKTASAWAEYADAATLAAKFNQAQRETYARDHSRAIEKRLSRVTFTMDEPPEGLEIKVDARTMGVAILGAPLPLDPGVHEVRASAPGYAPWAKELVVEKGPTEQSLAIPALARLPEPSVVSAPPVHAAETPPIDQRVPATPLAPPPKTNAWIPYVTIGVAAAGLGAGAAFGLIAFDRRDEANAHCSGATCDREGLAANRAAQTAATGSTIGFAIGAVGLVATALVLFVPPIQKRLRVGIGPGALVVGGSL